MLREPIARLISLYHFQRAHPDEVVERENLFLARIAKQYSLVEFFQLDEIRTHPSINNAMTRALVETVQEERWERAALPAQDGCTACLSVAMRALESMDAIGILERFDDSVSLICHAIGQEKPEKIEAKQVLDTLMTKGVLHQIAREPVTDAALRSIGELVQADLQLYSFAARLFQARYQQLNNRQGKQGRPDDQVPIVLPTVDASAERPGSGSPD
jgi:hypothetical protein